jgi:hypothetical protein
MEERDGVDCLKVTAETIRQRMAELQAQMELLEKFSNMGYDAQVCPDGEHEYICRDDAGYFADNHNDPDTYYYAAKFVCHKCGVVTHRKYTVSNPDAPVEDPWAALRAAEE